MRIGPRLIFCICFITVILYLTIVSLKWPWEVKLFPLTIGTLCLLIGLIQLFKELLRVKELGIKYDFVFSSPSDHVLSNHEVIRRALIYYSWLYLLFISIVLFGFFIATFFFLLLYTYFHAKLKWYHCILYSIIVWVSTIIFFDKILTLPWPHGLVLKWINISP